MIKLQLEQDEREEIALVSEERLDTSVLSDPNIWIGNTGATAHSTGNNSGVINRRFPQGSSMTQLDGTQVDTAMVGTLPVTVCNKNVKELRRVKLLRFLEKKSGDRESGIVTDVTESPSVPKPSIVNPLAR